jgi:hypothetical protein
MVLKPILKKGWAFRFWPFTTYAFGLEIYAIPYALCAMRDVEATMPAIAPMEDLRAVQNDIRPMFLAAFPLQLAPHDLRLRIMLCSMRYARSW